MESDADAARRQQNYQQALKVQTDNAWKVFAAFVLFFAAIGLAAWTGARKPEVWVVRLALAGIVIASLITPAVRWLHDRFRD